MGLKELRDLGLCIEHVRRGVCRFASRCRFSHDVEGARLRLGEEELGKLREEKVCVPFFTGRTCRFGQKCRLHHMERPR